MSLHCRDFYKLLARQKLVNSQRRFTHPTVLCITTTLNLISTVPNLIGIHWMVQSVILYQCKLLITCTEVKMNLILPWAVLVKLCVRIFNEEILNVNKSRSLDDFIIVLWSNVLNDVKEEKKIMRKKLYHFYWRRLWRDMKHVYILLDLL